MEPQDSYSDLIRHMAAEQLQKRAGRQFLSHSTKGDRRSPCRRTTLQRLSILNIAATLEEISVAQKKLTGEDIDEVRDFWESAFYTTKTVAATALRE